MAKYYDRDTKIAYVQQIEEGKMSVPQAANELGCCRATIYAWMRKLSEDPEHALPGSGHQKPNADNLQKLERENQQLKREIEFLKKAAAYFAGDQRKSTR